MIGSIFVHIKVEATETTMYSETLAQIRILSYQLPDPPRADRAMHQLLSTNIKLTRKVLTKNLINTIMKRNIGTNDVEKYVQVVCKQNVRKTRNIAMIRHAMKMKLDDAEYDERVTRKYFYEKLNEYRKVMIRGSLVDEEFRRMMKREVEDVWMEGKKKNANKVISLVRKYAPADEKDDTRDVLVTDAQLSDENGNMEKSVKSFGDVHINEEEKEALKVLYRIHQEVERG